MDGARREIPTYESKANFLGCGCSGAAYGTTISANDKRYKIGRTTPSSLYVTVEITTPSRWWNANHRHTYPRQKTRSRARKKPTRTNMELPLLPLNLVSVHLEAHSLRLNDMQRLHVVSEFELLPLLLKVLLDQVRQKIVPPERRREPLALRRLQRVFGERRRRGDVA